MHESSDQIIWVSQHSCGSMRCLNLNPIMHESSDQMIWVSQHSCGSMKCLNLNPIMHESSDQVIWVSQHSCISLKCLNLNPIMHESLDPMVWVSQHLQFFEVFKLKSNHAWVLRSNDLGQLTLFPSSTKWLNLNPIMTGILGLDDWGLLMLFLSFFKYLNSSTLPKVSIRTSYVYCYCQRYLSNQLYLLLLFKVTIRISCIWVKLVFSIIHTIQKKKDETK